MDRIFNIPYIIGEDAKTKHCRAFLVIGFIIICMIFIMKYHTNTRISFGDEYFVEKMQDDPIRKIYSSDGVKGQYIVLTNLNKQKIPIRKLIAVYGDGMLYHIDVNNAIIKNGKKSMSITFKLPDEVLLTQIILDININCSYKRNMLTTQVALKNKSNKTVWKYNETLPFDKRYVYVYIMTPNIDYSNDHTPNNSLCNDNNGINNSQENILNIALQHNTWI